MILVVEARESSEGVTEEHRDFHVREQQARVHACRGKCDEEANAEVAGKARKAGRLAALGEDGRRMTAMATNKTLPLELAAISGLHTNYWYWYRMRSERLAVPHGRCPCQLGTWGWDSTNAWACFLFD